MPLKMFFSIFVENMSELHDFTQWIWLRPKALFLLLFIPLFAVRLLRGREVLEHGAPWLFKSPLRYRVFEGAFRHMILVLSIAVVTLLILALAGPVREYAQREPSLNRPALAYVVDVSGSMSGLLWRRLQGFLEEFMKVADTLQNDKRIGVGVYYFSSFPLLNVSPTPSYRVLRGVVSRFNVASYGAGSGTEPSPSLWLAMLDLARMSDPALTTKLQHMKREHFFSCTVRGIQDDKLSFSMLVARFYDSATLEALRKAMQGKRIALGTDTEFDLTEHGELCMFRLFRFASVIGLSIDVVSTGPFVQQTERDFPPLIASTGGNFYPLSASFDGGNANLSREEELRIQQTVAAIFKSITVGTVVEKQIMHTSRDTLPERALIALAFVLAIAYIILRLLRPIIDW